jgi:hypothetical protein
VGKIKFVSMDKRDDADSYLRFPAFAMVVGVISESLDVRTNNGQDQRLESKANSKAAGRSAPQTSDQRRTTTLLLNQFVGELVGFEGEVVSAFKVACISRRLRILDV